MATDKRACARKPLPAEGQVRLPGGFHLDIKNRDISPRGARFHLKNHVVLPDTFELELLNPARTRIKRCQCQRRWQRRSEVGVRVLSYEVVSLI